MKNWTNYLDQAGKNLEELTKPVPSVFEKLPDPEIEEMERNLMRAIETWATGGNEPINYVYDSLKIARRLKERR